jgi:hypothetical protein
LPLVLIGLAHQLIVPDVALPGADDDPPDTGGVLLPLLLALPALLLLLELLPQPATASAPTAPARAASCQPRSRARPGFLGDPVLVMSSPTESS